MSTSWTPDETAAQLWNERCIFIGQFIGAFGYGVHLTLFVQCVHALYSGRKTRRHNWELLLFIFILFALGNIGNATSIFYAQKTFIDDRNYPGGPGAYFFEQSTQWVAVLCNSVYIVNTWFQDGLLLYRFWTIYSPKLLYRGGTSPYVLDFADSVCHCDPIPYWAISISMTVILTALIAGRLMFMRYRLKKLVGASSSMPYVTITAMLVESAAIYSINGIIFLVTYGLNDPTQNLWLPVLGQTQSIAPLLIILRVARGQAFTGATVDQLTSMRFGRSQATRTTNDGSTTVLDTFRSGRKNVRMGSHQDLEQKEDGGETESEFRVAVV
ncbi:hypothetical protein MSAN_02467700 [Mycena sanguinolenta]|uniref:Uncharacterized protein n=1 Tax=Mycena sanguinolenta TaxID=230812 RepID=A0A8H6U4F2_9AGAR|nr:hypothetical protein MSAN_02467700 [Mycena sanguinolenta]